MAPLTQHTFGICSGCARRHRSFLFVAEHCSVCAHAVSPHYLWFPYFQIHLLAKICNPQFDTHDAFMVIHCHVQSGEKFELLDAHIPSGVRTRQHFAILFQLSDCKQVSFPQFTQMLSRNGSVASGPPFQARKIAPHPKQGEGPG